MMIDEILAAEACTLRSNVQTRGFKYVKLTIIPVQESTITPFLYDVGEGRVFGTGVMVDVYLFDSEDRREQLENLAANLFISAFPWFRNVMFPKTATKAFKSADYIILNPRVPLGKITLKYAMLDQAPFFSTVGENINKYASKSAWVTVVSPSYTNVFCHLLRREMKNFPPNRITGLKLHIQALATNMIAHKLDVPPDSVKGVTVWGENILDYQMATVDAIPKVRDGVDNQYHKIRCKTYHEFQLQRQGLIWAESNAQKKLSRTYLGSKDKNNGEIEAEDLPNEGFDSECKCSPGATVKKAEQVIEKCLTVKKLQDQMISKIAEFLNSRTNKTEKVGKLEAEELLEKYKSFCRVNTCEPNYQIDDDGNPTNVLPLTHVIEDHYWLFESLPKECLKASAKSGLAVAQSLARHVSNLHQGTKKPFSITTCADDAYDFPRGVYTSGPGAVDESSGCVAFFPLYEMSENTQLELFRQMVILKKQLRLLETNFWTLERKAFDREKMPLIEKNEFGIAPSTFTGEHLRLVKKKSIGNKPPQNCKQLTDPATWHQFLNNKIQGEEESETKLDESAHQMTTSALDYSIEEMSGVYAHFL